MNKILKIATAFVAVLALSLTSCQKKDGLTVYGKELPTELEDVTIHFYEESGDVVDSVVVKNGAFKVQFDVPADAQPALRYLVINGLTTLTFFVETGELQFVSVGAEEGLGTLEFAGDESLLTMKLQNFSKEMNNLTEPYYNRIQECSDTIEGEPTPEQIQEIQAVQNEYIEVSNNYIQQQYQLNKDNALGAILFSQIRFATDEEFVAAYEAASESVKANERLKKRYETILKATETAVGKMYKDFEMDNAAGETKKLSDYMDGTNYLLVDFFASWCGPCKMSIPYIAELNKDFGAKGLRILSIGTFESSASDDKEVQRANFDKAVSEWGIVWDSFFDSESVGAQTYAVMGVPTLILFSPAGEILVRGHNIAEVRAKLKELL